MLNKTNKIHPKQNISNPDQIEQRSGTGLRRFKPLNTTGVRLSISLK
jgi:hypothetical protein